MKPVAIVTMVLACVVMLLIIASCMEFSAGMNHGLHEGSPLRTCAVATVCQWPRVRHTPEMKWLSSKQ